MKKTEVSKETKIDLSLIVIYAILMIILFTNNFFLRYELLNFTIVISVAFISFILFKLWFYTNVFLENKDKKALKFLVSFFLQTNNKNEIYKILNLYFSGYSENQIKKLVNKYFKKNDTLFKTGKFLRFESILYRKYLVYIMSSYKYSDKSIKKKEILKKYVNILFPSSNMLQHIDYYLFSASKKTNTDNCWHGKLLKVSGYSLKLRFQL